ncbi:MAG: GNAT family N-acetyltransferase, partial [Anaerolineae bacterium]
MRRAFPLPADLFFSWSGQVLVAEQEEVLLGGIVLKTFPLPGGRRGGLVKWIFADPNARGLGAGQALVEEGFSHLDAQGCDEIFACVEGNNSSSAKLFATRSFSILSPGEQFRRYGLRMFLVWLRAFHFCDIGHFLWVRPPEKGPDSPMLQWWGGLLFNLLFGWLALWRQQGFGVFDSVAFGALPAALLLLFGARHLTMLPAAAVQNLRLRYRVWESAFPV